MSKKDFLDESLIMREVSPSDPDKECKPGSTVAPDRLARVHAQIDALHVGVQAAIADSEYARQRAQADLAHASKFGIEGLARALLPFKDALEMALAVETNDVAAMRAGLELSLRQLQGALEKHGLREICPKPGEPFDAEKHRPLVKLGSEDNMRSVACTEQKGYEINGRVIRPAFVLTR